MLRKILFLLILFTHLAGNSQDTVHIKNLVNSMFPADSLYMGTAAHEWVLGTMTETIIDNEYSYITPANDFKQSYVHPTFDTWRWERADTWVQHCRENGQVIRMHAPISPQVSTWAKEDSRTADELERMLEEYVTAICQRYNDTAHIVWLDVVNEILNPDGTWFGPKPGTDSWENPWPKMGYDESVELNPPIYIKRAFEVANQYGPNIKLIINQHTDSKASWEKLKQVVYYLRNNGLRVDGVGWQAHVDLGWEKIPGNKERLYDFIDWCHQNDLEFHITEFNVWLRTGDELKYEGQADSFYEIVKLAASKYKNGIVGINFWHIRAEETNQPTRDGGLWTNDRIPKKAYYDVKRALYEIANKTGPTIKTTPVRSAVVNEEYRFEPEIVGVVGQVSYDLSTDKQSDLLTLSENGVLSGTPLVEDTINITYTVTDDIGPRELKYELIIYGEKLQILSEPANEATVGYNYEYQLEWSGEGTWTLETDPDAGWLTIDEKGQLSGIPDSTGQYRVTVKLKRNDQVTEQTFALQVYDKLEITSSPKTEATEDKPYRYQVIFKGFAEFSLVTDPVADWLTIDENGTLSGTPLQADTIHVIITAWNDLTTVTQEFDLHIAESLEFVSTPIDTARVGELYQYQVEHRGIGDIVFYTGKPADWLSMDSTKLISGIPPNPDTLKVTLKLFNDATTTFQVYNLVIHRPLAVSQDQFPSFEVYPNPAEERFIISNLIPGDRVTVHDQSGKLKYDARALSEKIILPVHSWIKGAYYIRHRDQTKLVIVQ
ncbi:MAG: endo-1,4-beta-xylanase [Bacteroidales bacterium]|nr:endo-1,4-beta-xylanase [Bacteroidales bacterium]